MQLFTDGSVHPPSRIGYGAYLAITNPQENPDVHLKRFENTSSSQLELETLIWALREQNPQEVTIYTDSQTIIGLPARRARFEARNYLTRQNQPIKHTLLYREFFQLTDQMNCTLIKMKGHRVSHEKTDLDHLFTRVDRASRRALRSDTHCI
ncbi:MAG: RNase H family protein [Pontiella sp.]